MNISRTNLTASAPQVPHISASMSHANAKAAVASVHPPCKPGMASELIEIADDLANKLIECQAASVAWLIKAGSILRDYQSQLPRGDMSAIYGSGKLPFGQRYGQMLAAVSRNPALSNPTLLRFLPVSITALVVLASIHSNLIEQGIQDGTIHRGLTQRTAMDAARKLNTGASEE